MIDFEFGILFIYVIISDHKSKTIKLSIMKNLVSLVSAMLLIICLVSCEKSNTSKEEMAPVATAINETNKYGSFDSQVEWGEHLVTILDCNVCHTPKKMSEKGPVWDMDLMLSGRPADRPGLDINREEMESKGLTVTGDLTEWAGPWGVSYAGNLTPHETGIGSWSEEQFFLAMRKGKYKGLAATRTLLPPMPWESFSHMTDDEIKAIFVYLKSVKPIDNVVPEALPPMTAK